MPNIPEIKIGNIVYQLTDKELRENVEIVKKHVADIDTRTNDILSFINYDYDDPIRYPMGDGSTWKKAIEINRDGTTVKITKAAGTSVDIRIKLSGEFDLAGNNSGLDAWNTGISLTTGHQYKVSCRFMSGSAILENVANYSGMVQAFETGTHSSVGTYTQKDGLFERTFTATANKSYNLSFLAEKNVAYTNAEYLITIEDLTESEFVNLQNQIDNLDTYSEYTTATQLVSGNITGTGAAGDNNQFIRTYGGGSGLPKIEQGNVIIAENGFALVNVHIFSSKSLSTLNHIASLTVIDQNRFEIPDEYIGKYVGFTVNEPGKQGQDISADVSSAMQNVKIVKEKNLHKTINGLSTRIDSIEADELLVPEYYFDDNYLDIKVTGINTIGIDIGVKSLRTVFITDYHYEDNSRKSPALIKYLMRKTGIRSVIFGGDAMNHDYTSKIGGYNKICTFLDDFREIRGSANMYLVTGNHEMNNADLSHGTVELPKSVTYSLFNEPIFFKITPLWASGKNTNSFYVDDDVAKVRFYCIDCTSGASIQKAYLDVILPSFLTVPEGYFVVVFSHSGVESYTSDGGTPPVYTITAITAGLDAIMQTGKALNDGANAIITAVIGGNTYTWNLDFTGKARTFVGAFIGHSHLDGYYIYNNRFPVIATLCDTGAYRDSHPYRIAGTITEQAFDVVQIDIATQRIYCTRIGFGNDRTFSFGNNAGLI